MATPQQKPLTYLRDVFQGPVETGLGFVFALLLLCSAYLKLFADWNDYQYPGEAQGYTNWAFYGSLVVLAVLFGVPLFSRERRAARLRSQEDAANR